MSVVAWDGKSIASDRQTTYGDLKVGRNKMVQLSTGEVLACTGIHCQGLALWKWYSDGQKALAWPSFQKTSDWSILIVASKDGAKFFETVPEPMPVEQEYMAWGSGRDFALGAMAKGATAKEAVEIACQFNVLCGMGVQEFKL